MSNQNTAFKSFLKYVPGKVILVTPISTVAANSQNSGSGTKVDFIEETIFS